MPERRMFSKTVIDSDNFLEMPQSSQLLYFHLAMRADDEGFVNNSRRIGRLIGASDDDLRVLAAKGYIIPFESGIIVISHWHIHNYLRSDRKKPTDCIEEQKQLYMLENGVYVLESVLENTGYKRILDRCQSVDGQMSGRCQSNVSQLIDRCQSNVSQSVDRCQADVSQMSVKNYANDSQLVDKCQADARQVSTKCQQNDRQMSAQDRLGKDSIGKDSIGEDSIDEDNEVKHPLQQLSSTTACARDPTPVDEGMSKAKQVNKLSEEFGLGIIPKLFCSLKAEGLSVIDETYEELRQRCKRLTAQ